MLVNNLNPIIFSIGSLEVRYYGVIYALGFVISYFFLKYFAKKGQINLTEEQISDILFYNILGVVIGARIFTVLFWDPSYYLANPLKIFAVWQGGLSFHGAVVGAILVTYYYAKKHKIPVMKLFDLIAIPAAIATALGRLGNYFNSELYGPRTNAPWCIVFKRVDDACRHPYQLYSALKRTILFGILFFLNERKHKDGFIFWNFIFWFGLGRFIIDFWRVDQIYFGLSTGQWLSIAMILGGAYVLLRYYKDDIFTKA